MKLLKSKKTLSVLVTGTGMAYLQIANFFITILLAKHLTTSDFGKFQLLFTLVTTLSILAKVGLDEGFVFFIEKIKIKGENVKKLVTYIVILTTIIALSIGLLISFQASLIDKYLIEKIDFNYELKIILYYLPSFVLFVTTAALLRGLEIFKIRAIFTYFLAPTLFLLLIWLSIHKDGSLQLSSVYNFRIFTFLLLATISIIVIYWHIREKEKKLLTVLTIKQYHALSFSLIFIALVQYMAEQPIIDLLLLSNLVDAEDVAIYAVNYRLAIVPLMVYLVFNIIYTTKLTNLFISEKHEELIKLYKLAKRRMFYLTITILITLIFSYDFIIQLFGTEYSAGKYVFIILSLGFSFMSMNGLNTSMLIIYGRKKNEFYLNIIYIIVLVTIGYFLTREHGILGLASLNTVLLILTVLSRKRIVERLFHQYK